MCVGCREAAEKAALVRLALVDGVVVTDRTGHLPGRGVYVHRRAGCLSAALDRDALPRAFRRPVTVPDETVDLFS
jgi:predicted RNA-binding protein YlxR (DUF448 family)